MSEGHPQDISLRERIAALEATMRSLNTRVDRLSDNVHGSAMATTKLSESVAVLASKVAEMRSTRPPGRTEMSAAAAGGGLAILALWEALIRRMLTP